jgi:hypothetical protein
MMYRSIDIWARREDGTVVRYRCFELLPDRTYCVQSADFFRLPLDDNQVRQLDRQFMELLLEEPPEIRAGAYSTIAEAIAAHDRDFSDEV